MDTRQLPLGPMPSLETGEIHVWFARPADLALPALVTGSDRTRSLRHARMQQHFLLRLLLGRYLGCAGRDLRLVRNAAGKPMLDGLTGNSGEKLAFSLSHAGGWLAIAFGLGLEPGIDIEPSGRSVRWRELAQRWFPAGEARAIEAADSPAREFLRRWTAREAMVKSMGATIAASLSALQLDPLDPDRPTQVPGHWPEPLQWSLRRPEAPGGVVVCLACTGRLRRLRSLHLQTPAISPPAASEG